VRRAAARAGYTSACAVVNRLPDGEHALALPRLTVRRGMDLDTFGELVEGRQVFRTYAFDRVLTGGYAVVRRLRRATRRAGS
jgi:hypothetical protein